ncbi:MAG: hypothetical protein ACK4N5_08790 [Myxococcales bacterium]
MAFAFLEAPGWGEERFMSGSKALVKAVCAVAFISLASCGGSDEGLGTPDAGQSPDAGGGGGPVAYARDIQPIWDGKCISCHSAANASGGLNLAAGASHAALVNVDAQCGNLKRVTPSDKTRSALWLKTAGEAGCGAEMPTGNALKRSSPAEFQKLEQWIDQGAKND